MADLKVRLIAEDGGMKAAVDGATRDISRFGEVATRSTRALGSGMGVARDEMAGAARETVSSLRTISALLASGHIRKLTDEYFDLSNVIGAVFTGRAVVAIGEYSSSLVSSISATVQQRTAVAANAVALTEQTRTLAANYAATVSAGVASQTYTQSLSRQVAASAAAAGAARAQAASMSVSSGIMAAMGGPLGIAALAAGALALWVTSAKDASAASDKLTKSNKSLSDGMKELSAQAIAIRIITYQDTLAKIGGSNPAATAMFRQKIADDEKLIRDQYAAAKRIEDLLSRQRPTEKKVAALSPSRVTAKSVEAWAIEEAEKLRSLLAKDGEVLAQRLRKDFEILSDEVEKYQGLLNSGAISQETFNRAVMDAGQQFAGTAEKIKESATDAAKKSGDEVAQIYKDSATSIRGAFRDTFRDVFDNGVQGFKGMGNRMLDVFKDVVADMATLAIARPIILPIVSAMGGALGVSGSAQASVLQQLGGGSGAIGNLGGLAGGLGAFGGGFGAGLSGGFGAASTAASGAAFSTGIGALSSIGAFAGAALPWVGGALLLNQVTGGGLFGTKSKVKDTGYELSLNGGDVSGRSYIDRERKKSLFRGTARSTAYGAADPALIAQLDATFAAINSSIVGGAQGLGISTAKNFLDGFSSTSKVSGTGEEAIQKWVTSVTAEMYQGLLKGGGLSGLLDQFNKSSATKNKFGLGKLETSSDPATIKAMGDAIFAIGRYLSANPIKDAAEGMRIANRTLKEQYDEQRASLVSLVSGYDGSIDATQKLAAATQERYQLEIQLLNQISAVRSGVKDFLGGSIESIRQSNMAPSELYGYLTNKAETLAGQLGGASDPARIKQLSEQINALTNQAYGLVPEAARGTLGPQFIQFLEQVQGTADTRLAGMAQGVQDSQQQMARTVQDTMERVARRLEEVAQKQLEAAQATHEAAREQMRSTNQMGEFRYG